MGHSINLYNRICSYFMPSILKTKERRVLRYLNKYGFTNIRLTARVAGSLASIAEEVVELEQHFIDSLNSNLNVDLVARGILLLFEYLFIIITKVIWLYWLVNNNVHNVHNLTYIYN